MLRERARRANMTVEQRAHDAQMQRQRRDAETEEQRAQRQAHDAQVRADRIAAMTEEQRAQQRARHAQQQRALQHALSDEQRAAINARRVQQRRQQRPHHNAYRKAAGDSLASISVHTLQARVTCMRCGAIMWVEERTAGTPTFPLFGLCCSKGRVHLPALQQPPPPLHDLLTGSSAPALSFREHIRAFNNALALASAAARVDRSISSGLQWFSINGAMHHIMGPARPAPDQTAKFAQLWILDPATAHQTRAEQYDRLDRGLLLVSVCRAWGA